MLSIHLCTLISWSPTSHRLDLCTVMKPTEVFIHVYVQCNSCIWKFTVIHVLTKAFYTFINFLAYPVDLVFSSKSTVGLCSFSKLMYKNMMKLLNKRAHAFPIRCLHDILVFGHCHSHY